MDLRTCDLDKMHQIQLTYRLAVGSIDDLMDLLADKLYDPATHMSLSTGISGHSQEKAVIVSTSVETDDPEEATKAAVVLISNALRDVPNLPAPEVTCTKEDPDETREFLEWLDKVQAEEDPE